MLIIKCLILIFISISLYAQSDKTEQIDVKVEAVLYLPASQGTISNITNNVPSSTSFEDDLGYSTSKASYFSSEITFDYDYMINLKLDYFNILDNKDTVLNAQKIIADGTFSSGVSTVLDYQEANAIFYQDFKVKGDYFVVFGEPFYSGDIEFDVGINIKSIDWNININKTLESSEQIAWINIKENIGLPYLGIKYYLYNLVLYADASALSFSEAKASSYEVGLDFKVIDTLYLTVGYLYRKIEAVDDADTIKFSIKGYKGGFKYAF